MPDFASLHLERLNTEMATMTEALKLFDYVPYENVSAIPTDDPNGTSQSNIDDKAELSLLLQNAEAYVTELKNSTHHLINTSGTTEVSIAGADDAMVLHHSHGKVSAGSSLRAYTGYKRMSLHSNLR